MLTFLGLTLVLALSCKHAVSSDFEGAPRLITSSLSCTSCKHKDGQDLGSRVCNACSLHAAINTLIYRSSSAI